ncbi:YOR322C [Saccharomyces arboricola H-6]|uniref:YOR322C n=1 Tax=Saccharomyces arboricola (strain H-6 / AS 2.3317 / CBS 10644) TaxID=1160507 RepID=J8PHQ6_SACAR|nr:YOR322C [Saccharomyces arboricola H-6]
MAFARLTSGHQPSHNSNKKGQCHPLALSIDIESPPCVLYGSAVESSGAVLSGLFTVTVIDPYSSNEDKYLKTSESNVSVSSKSLKRKSTFGTALSSRLSNLSGSSSALSPTTSSVSLSHSSTLANSRIMAGYTKITIMSVTLTLVQKINFHKPFVPNSSSIQTCMNCKTKITNMKSWEIQKNTQDISVGKHSYPFSYLIPGSVPCSSSLGAAAETQVKYELIAVVTYMDPYRKVLSSTHSTPRKESSPSKKQLLQLVMPIAVTRSVPRGPDKNSLRVFPPTELTAAAVLPNVVYPKSTFPLEMKLDGVSSGDRRWRMRKLSWRIEETTRVKGHSCPVHKHELRRLEEQVKIKELEKGKKPRSHIKRYGELGPQIRVAVNSLENMPSQRLPGEPSNEQASSSSGPVSADNFGLDDESPVIEDGEAQPGSEFIHPSDDALRQELLMQQQRARRQQLQQELKNNSTLFTEEVRIISKGEMKSGWKTDFYNNGKIELVTEIDCMGLNSGVSNPVMHSSTLQAPTTNSNKSSINVACDVQDPNLGLYVNHILAVEIVVAEETLQYANGQPIRKSNTKGSKDSSNGTMSVHNPDQRLAELSPMFANRNTPKIRRMEPEDITPVSSNKSNHSINKDKSINGGTNSNIVSVPTGAARVLRMQFRLTVTERSGLGISWDEEVPPIYQDVKLLSPPSYELSTNNKTKNKLYSTMSTLIGSANGFMDSSGDDEDDIDGDDGIDGIDESQGTGSSSNIQETLVSQNKLTIPPTAHYYRSASTSQRSLTAVQSPPLESVVSVQGSVPFRGQVLTPHNTRDIRLQNFSDVLDSNRITQ